MQEFERPEYIFEEESEHTFLMLRLLTILSMPQTTVERFGLLIPGWPGREDHGHKAGGVTLGKRRYSAEHRYA